MSCIIGMAGLAEASCAWELMISTAVLIPAGILILIAWFKWSRMAAVIATAIAIGHGALFQPWRILLWPGDAAALSDPDYIYWRFRFRVAAAAWTIVFAAAAFLVALIRARVKEVSSAATMV